MSYLKQTFNQIVFSYDPEQYLPAYQNGQLINFDDFVSYKVRELAVVIFKSTIGLIDLITNTIMRLIEQWYTFDGLERGRGLV